MKTVKGSKLSREHRERIRLGVLKSWRSPKRRKRRTRAQIKADWNARPWSRTIPGRPRRLGLEHFDLDESGDKLVRKPGVWLIGGPEPVFVPRGESVVAAHEQRAGIAPLAPSAASLGF